MACSSYATSCDLQLIENLWRKLKSAPKERNHTITQDIRQNAMEKAEKLMTDKFKNL